MRRAFLILCMSGLVGSVIIPAVPVSAVSRDEWNAGRILDDTMFTDKGAMSVQDIQNFLNSHISNGGCDTYGTRTLESWYYAPDYNNDGRATHAEYAKYAGYGDNYIFTCLKDYYEVPKTSSGDYDPQSNYGGAPIPEGALSAAQIIYNAAQKYNISPKTLLVKIHTESAGPLSTDDWPFKKQYLYAMGAHCPDTAEGHKCDPNWRGFSLQLDEAAALMRSYLDGMQEAWWPFKKPFQTNDILWQDVHVKDCGSGPVYIETKATAALYTYTPYQPDGDALNNMYGTGGECSTYGNRNFWRTWYDWFGSPMGYIYRWSPVSQNLYTDSSKQTTLDPMNIQKGQRFFANITVRNVGTKTWQRGEIQIGTSQPQNRPSPFKDWTWPSTQNNRAGTFNEESVAPGEIATFDFWMQAPNYSISSDEYFDLVANGNTFLNDMGLNFKLRVAVEVLTWQELSKNIYVDQTKRVQARYSDLKPNYRYVISLVMRNTGNTTWQRGKIQLGTWLPTNHPSPFKDWTWPSTQNNRAGTFNEESVAPGQIGTFDFWVITPNKPASSWYESFNLVNDEQQKWMVEIGQQFAYTINMPHYGYTPISMSLFTDSSKQTPQDAGSIAAGQRFFASIKVKNFGTKPWYKNEEVMATSLSQDRPSPFKDWTWPSTQNNRAGTFNEEKVAPGGIATFDFWMQAPNTPGVYSENFNVLAENIAWMNDMNLNYTLTVK